MNWKINIGLCCLLILNCKKNPGNSQNLGKETLSSTTNHYLIEPDELLKIYNKQGIKIIDFRKPELYQENHIEGAINIWRNDIEDQSYPYGGMMAQKNQIEKLFSGLGIGSKDTLIIYDNNGLCDATRLWWVLQNHDFHQIKLLHGGLTEFKLKGGKTTDLKPNNVESEFKLNDSSSMKYLVSRDEMLRAVGSSIVFLDSRSGDEFSGKRKKSGAARGGRIPNSIQLDWSHNINFDGDKKFKSTEDLQNNYKDFVTIDDTIIVYCHSGVRSAHTTFVLTQLLGYRNVKNYDGSWTEWSYYNDLPIEQDSITTIYK